MRVVERRALDNRQKQNNNHVRADIPTLRIGWRWLLMMCIASKVTIAWRHRWIIREKTTCGIHTAVFSDNFWNADEQRETIGIPSSRLDTSLSSTYRVFVRYVLFPFHSTIQQQQPKQDYHRVDRSIGDRELYERRDLHTMLKTKTMSCRRLYLARSHHSRSVLHQRHLSWREHNQHEHRLEYRRPACIYAQQRRGPSGIAIEQ